MKVPAKRVLGGLAAVLSMTVATIACAEDGLKLVNPGELRVLINPIYPPHGIRQS